MKGLLREWASNLEYATGPKATEATKVRPTTLTPDGIQPGSGNRVSAEEMNWILNILLKGELRNRHAAFSSWRLTTDADLDEPECAVWHPGRGVTYLSGDTNDVIRMGDPDSQVNSSNALALLNTGPRRATTWIDASGAPRVLLVGGFSTTGIKAGWDDASGALANSTTLAMTGGQQYTIGIAWDSDNETVITVNYDTDGGFPVRMAYFDAATETLSNASSASLVNLAIAHGPQNVLCYGNGKAVAVIPVLGGGPTNGPWCMTSEDGGNTWTDRTAPTALHAPTGNADQVAGVFYSPDFLGLGPQYLCAQYSDTNGFTLHYGAADGSSWTAVTVPAEMDALLADASNPCCAQLLGDTLVVSEGPRIFVWDLALNKVFVVTPESGIDILGMLFDGTRFILDMASNNIRVSPFVAPALDLTGVEVDS